MSKFDCATNKIIILISESKTEEDLSHAKNTMEWVRKLRPDADEILQLAGLAHDIQRALPDRLEKSEFTTYDDYQWAHAEKSADVASQIAEDCGYSANEASRLNHIIAQGEFHSEEADVQLLRDANSISIFDNNIAFYLKNKGEDWTRKKMHQNFEFASPHAKKHITKLLRAKPRHNLLGV